MKTMPLCMLLLSTFTASTMALSPASSAMFFEGLTGEWTGTGTARRTADADPLNLNCSFSTEAGEGVLNLEGSCRVLAIIRQSVSASLESADGETYEGTYIGPEGGRSVLSGTRSGNAIDLDVAWAEPVNGDSAARMELQRPDADTLVIRTIDQSPTTGAEVVTSEITLARR